MQINVSRDTGEYGAENIEALFAAFPQYAGRALASALASEGYRLRGIIRDTIRGGGPDGGWPQLNPHTGILARAKKGTIRNWRLSRKGLKKGEASRRIYDDRKRHMTSTRRSPLLRLAGAVRYRVDRQELYASIGFINDDAKGFRIRRIVGHAARGFRTPLTQRMRRFAFAAGFPLRRDTSDLVSPPRPLIRPFFEKEKGNIRRNISLRVVRNITRYRYGLKKDGDAIPHQEGGGER